MIICSFVREAQLPYIQFLGAAGTVTGSKHLINTGDLSGKKGIQVLVDCGLFQGPKEWREQTGVAHRCPQRKLMPSFSRTPIWIIAAGFHASSAGDFADHLRYAPTIDLCGIILPDSGHLQEEDARFYNKVNKSKHHPALPLYTFDEAQNSLQYFRPVQIGGDGSSVA